MLLDLYSQSNNFIYLQPHLKRDSDRTHYTTTKISSSSKQSKQISIKVTSAYFKSNAPLTQHLEPTPTSSQLPLLIIPYFTSISTVEEIRQDDIIIEHLLQLTSHILL